jgi:hypothetical protein
MYVRMYEAPVYAHEGRHAIDHLPSSYKRYKKAGLMDRATWPTESEYLAKLSEIAFAPDPALAFSRASGSSTGDNSAYARASARLRKAVVAWMAEHAEEIRGIDLSRPLLPQFDLLTDEQVRELFRSIDPLAEHDG